ncbi:MAG: hypothetical protein RL722_316 [Pseudomonadota bacterium]
MPIATRGARPGRSGRRRLLQGLAAGGLLGPASLWQVQAQVLPGLPSDGGAAFRAAIRAWIGNDSLVPQTGRVQVEIAELIDNGNAVPVRLRVASPMTPADHVSALALFAERNPLPEVISVRLGPSSGRAEFGTRIRLATSQQLVALARLSDGSVWQQSLKVIVTLAACLEGDGDGP